MVLLGVDHGHICGWFYDGFCCGFMVAYDGFMVVGDGFMLVLWCFYGDNDGFMVVNDALMMVYVGF